MLDILKKYGIREDLLQDLKYFRNYYKTDDDVISRIQKPDTFYYGIDI